MLDPSSPRALGARFVFPVSSPPIANGVVTIRGGTIIGVGTEPLDCPVQDLGNVAILPGFVNAHTHLEFSDLPQPLGTPGMALPDWIRQVIAHRQAAAGDAGHAVQLGLRESLLAGTTGLGEIATTDWRHDPSIVGNDMPWVTMFFESIGPTRDRVATTAVAAEQFLSASTNDPQILPGLSPHAPYTVHTELLTALVALSQKFQVPLAMHLAESREELELLRCGGGPFRELLGDLNSWDPGPEARHSSILEYLQLLAQAPRALVVHGNYLDAKEMKFIAAHAARMAVVYCPRTHHFFGHDPYPLAKMLKLGITVGLGTDSRASNPDLSLLAEMRHVAEHHPEVRPSTVLELGTLAGARALGIENLAGSLQVGKRANLAILSLADSNVRDPHEMLFTKTAPVEQIWLNGQSAVYSQTTTGNS